MVHVLSLSVTVLQRCKEVWIELEMFYYVF